MFAVALRLILTMFAFFDSSHSWGAGEEKLDQNRGIVAEIKEGQRSRITNYFFPFLVCQTGVVTDGSPKVVADHLRTMLKKSAVPYKGHYGKSGAPSSKITPDGFPFPADATSGDQLSGLANCNNEFCIMKLQTQSEKPILAQGKDRLPIFRRLVTNRVRAFLEKNELLGYENRASNRDYVSKMIRKMAYLEKDYPKCTKFFDVDFWKKAPTGCAISESFVRAEMLTLPGTILQPILRISEDFEFVENGAHVFFEIHIYTNHYFDSSARVFEVMPLKDSKDKSVVTVTDLMEIDELTKGGVVKLLYQGKIESAVINEQISEIENLEKTK